MAWAGLTGAFMTIRHWGVDAAPTPLPLGYNFVLARIRNNPQKNQARPVNNLVQKVALSLQDHICIREKAIRDLAGVARSDNCADATRTQILEGITQIACLKPPVRRPHLFAAPGFEERSLSEILAIPGQNDPFLDRIAKNRGEAGYKQLFDMLVDIQEEKSKGEGRSPPDLNPALERIAEFGCGQKGEAAVRAINYLSKHTGDYQTAGRIEKVMNANPGGASIDALQDLLDHYRDVSSRLEGKKDGTGAPAELTKAGLNLARATNTIMQFDNLFVAATTGDDDKRQLLTDTLYRIENALGRQIDSCSGLVEKMQQMQRDCRTEITEPVKERPSKPWKIVWPKGPCY